MFYSIQCLVVVEIFQSLNVCLSLIFLPYICYVCVCVSVSVCYYTLLSYFINAPCGNPSTPSNPIRHPPALPFVPFQLLSRAVQTPRSADIFEISPRPFSATPSTNAGFQYSRSPPRSDFFSNGLTASRSFPASNRQQAGSSQRKSPFSSSSGGFPELATTETPQVSEVALEVGFWLSYSLHGDSWLTSDHCWMDNGCVCLTL